MNDDNGTTPTGREYVFRLARGYWASQTLFVGLHLGIFELLSGEEKSANEVAQLAGTDPRATAIFLDALVGLDLLEKGASGYVNTDVAQNHLVKGCQYYQGDSVHHYYNLWDNWVDMEKAVRTGKPVAFDIPEKHPYEHRLQDFIKAMDNVASWKSERICEIVDLSDCRRLLDIGGGAGTYTIAFAKKYPLLRAVVYDLAQVIQMAEEHIAESGLSDRIAVRAGDFTTESLGLRIFDVVLLSNVLHTYNTKTCGDILQRVHAALTDSGRVLIHDYIPDDISCHPRGAALFSLNMLLGTIGGKAYTTTELEGMLAESGFSIIARIPVKGSSTILISQKR